MPFDLTKLTDDDFDGLIANEGDNTPSVFEEALKTNADEQANLQGLSRELKAPQFAIEGDVAGMERQRQLQSANLNQTREQNPTTYRYLGDYNKAVIVQDDIDAMKIFENTLKSIDPRNFIPDVDLGKTFSGATEGALLGFTEQRLGAQIKGVDKLQSTRDLIPASAMPMGMEMEAAFASEEMAQTLGIRDDAHLEQLKEQSIESLIGEIKQVHDEQKKLTPEDLNTMEEGIRAGYQSLINMAPGFTATLLTGGRALPMLTTMGAQSYTSSYADARAEGLDENTAGWKATIDAAIEVGTEVLPTGTLTRIVTGNTKDKLTKEALKFMVQEMGTEQLATLGQSINDYGFDLDEQMAAATSVEEMVNIQMQRQAVTAIATVVAGGGQTAVALSVNKAVQAVSGQTQQNEARAQEEQVALDRINEAAKQSKTRQRDVETFKQFIEEADGDADTHVFITAREVREYLRDKDIQADPTLQKLDEVSREAAAVDGDMSMPIADFAAEIAGTEHFEALRPFMTLSEDAVAPAQLDEARENSQQYVENLVQEAEQNVSEYVEAQEIFQTVRQQLVDTGMVNERNASAMAQIVPAWATVYAKANGKTVAQVYEESGLTIEGPQTGEKARLAAEEELLSQVELSELESENFTNTTGDSDVDVKISRVVNMTPDEYLQQAFEATDGQLGGTFESWMGSNAQEQNTRDQYADALIAGDKFPLPYIDLDSGSQDGRNRAMAAKQAGIDMIPVGVVDLPSVEAQIAELEEDLVDAKGYRKFRLTEKLESLKASQTADLLAQSEVAEKNLFVAHNLSAENILAAADLGGLAAPSIAVGKVGPGFDSFGEVSLIADPSLLDDPKARTFDADIYSPRQPRSTYDIDVKSFREFVGKLDPDNLGLSLPDIQSLENGDGPDTLARSNGVKMHWLQLQGKAPKLKNQKIEPTIRKASKLDIFDVRDEKFQEIARQHYQKIVDDTAAKFPERSERFEEMFFMENGKVAVQSLYDFESKVRNFKNSGGKDTKQLRSDIEAKFRVKKTKSEYEQWVTEQFNEMVTGEKLFKGFTPSGNRKYVPYNMVNVVKEMTQELQAGEAYFYGAGSVRSAYAKELKNLDQIRAKRDSIISEDEFAQIKEDSSQVFESAMDDLKPFYKFDADGWGYINDAGSAIAEGPKGQREAFNLTPESKKIIDDLTEYLAALPTLYFESKVQRAVGFEEFNTAVVPRGMRKDALQVLKDAGLKIKTYDPSGKGKSRDEVIAEQEKLLFQKDDQTRGYYDPSNSIIRLTESADLSTFLHEFAHFMLEMERSADGVTLKQTNGWFKRNAAEVAIEASDTPEGGQLTMSVTSQEVEDFLDFGTTGEPLRDQAINRAIHEQFARGFETYLMEGKAPSVELRNVFQQFARWLTQIYQRIRGDLQVNLDQEMREVFDRMLATEEQIQAAQARARVEPLFTDATTAGMTEEEFERYQQKQQKSSNKAAETLRDQMIAEITRQQKKWWKAEKADLVDEQTEELKGERVHAAREKLKTGDLKLDRAVIKDQYGEQKTDKLGRKSTRIPNQLTGMTAPSSDAVHPDIAAAGLGYSSGDEMIQDLLTAPKLTEAADQQAEEVMKERHGDILNDGTIERLADEAVQNEERGRLLLTELKALTRGTSQAQLERQAIKDAAKDRIGKLSFREIHPGKYRKAEIKAAQESAKMLAEGNREGAAAAKTRQVVNYYLGMEATKAKSETMKIVDTMGRYRKKRVQQEIQKAENSYWEQIVKILGRFEFRKSATLGQVDEINQSLEAWANERIENDGDGLVLTPAVLDELYTTHWKNVPFSDLQGINDSVKNIEFVARYSNRMKLQGEEIEFKKLVQEWTDHIGLQDQRFAKKSERSRIDDAREATPVEHMRRWAAQMTKVPFLASWLDGGERAGMSHDILMQQLNDALDAKMRLMDEVATPVMELLMNRSKETKKRYNQKIWIPEINDNLMGHQIVAVALNTGNMGNLRKLLLGEGWASPEIDEEISFNNPKLRAVLRHMTKEDWQLVQQIWDQMETLYPQLAEVHRKTTGLTPPKVESTPITIEIDGETLELKGGYYPVKYSPKRSHDAEKNAEKRDAETESMFNNTASIQASVNAGSTNERTGFYDRIHLSLEVVPDHFNETIHYITHHDAIRQLNRLIQNRQVADAITGVLGEEEFKLLKPWLNDVAKDGRGQPTKTYVDEAFQRLRLGTTLGVMGFSASTGIMQVFGLFTTAAEVGVGPTLKAIYTTVGKAWYMKKLRQLLGSTDDMQTGMDFAMERSKVMPHRMKTMDREIRNAMDRLSGKRGFIAAAQETSMKHIGLIQTYTVDLPTWLAMYDKTLSETGEEQKAINAADWAVENLQGSGATKDMATILRNQGKIHTTFTMFMTFFSSLGNLSRDTVKGTKSGLYSPTSVAAKLAFLYFIPVFMEMLMRGEFEEPEDDDENRLMSYLTATALYPMTSMPFVRDVASGLFGDYGYNSSPVASALEKGIQGYKQIGERAFTDEEITASAKKNAAKLTGVALQIPGISQAWRTGEHLHEVMAEGEEFTIRELLFGPDRD